MPPYFPTPAPTVPVAAPTAAPTAPAAAGAPTEVPTQPPAKQGEFDIMELIGGFAEQFPLLGMIFKLFTQAKNQQKPAAPAPATPVRPPTEAEKAQARFSITPLGRAMDKGGAVSGFELKKGLQVGMEASYDVLAAAIKDPAQRGDVYKNVQELMRSHPLTDADKKQLGDEVTAAVADTGKKNKLVADMAKTRAIKDGEKEKIAALEKELDDAVKDPKKMDALVTGLASAGVLTGSGQKNLEAEISKSVADAKGFDMLMGRLKKEAGEKLTEKLGKSIPNDVHVVITKNGMAALAVPDPSQPGKVTVVAAGRLEANEGGGMSVPLLEDGARFSVAIGPDGRVDANAVDVQLNLAAGRAAASGKDTGSVDIMSGEVKTAAGVTPMDEMVQKFKESKGTGGGTPSSIPLAGPVVPGVEGPVR